MKLFTAFQGSLDGVMKEFSKSQELCDHTFGAHPNSVKFTVEDANTVKAYIQDPT